MRRATGVALALIVALVGCVPKTPVDDADPNGTLTTLGGEGVLDPQLANPLGPTVLMVFEPPLRLDRKTLRPVPGAAELPDISSDGLTYRLKIRDDSRFSDGTSVRARDFVYGITRLCDPTIKGPYAPLASLIVGCEQWSLLDPKKDPPEKQREAKARLTETGARATAERELTIQLVQPAAFFSAVLTMWSFAPVRETDVTHGGDEWTEPKNGTYVGNGPYVLSEWKHDERLVFTPNHFYRTQPKLKRWTRVFIESGVALNAYRHDEVDVFSGAGQESASLVRQIEADPALRPDLRRFPNGCSNFLVLNGRRPPFDDPAVRLAFAKSLDRDAYVRDVLGGFGKGALSLIPPGNPGHDAADTVQSFDPADARRLLASSRYGRPGQMPSITLTYVGETPAVRDRVEWLRSQWSSNLGVTLITEQVDSITLSELRRKPETISHVAGYNQAWCPDYPDQQDWLTLLFHSKSFSGVIRLSGFADPEFDRLVTRADGERDLARRDELYRTASRRLSSAAVAIFIFAPEAIELRKPWVRGLGDFGAFTFGAAGRPEDVYVVKRR